MADDRWDAGTWDGARREQLRNSLRLTVRERLQNLEGLYATGERLADAGREARERSDDTPGTIRLDGCRPTPLAGYLKALGILRLVVEQEADPEARGHWEGDRFVLTTRLDPDELVKFFLEEYQPTPILAPWNGGSGFFPKDNTEGIDALEAGSAPRFELVRRTAASMREVLNGMGLSEKPGTQEKERLLVRLRASLGDEALPWMDAALLLTAESPHYPPLLGTGGNDGRLDFTNNFVRHLTNRFNPDSGEPTPRTAALLRVALYRMGAPELEKAAIGQFAPDAAGGPNASSGFEGTAQVNPWDFILMLEGAVLFAASATRRLEGSGDAGMSFPFTVTAVGAGTGGAALSDEGTARGEIWMPMWEQPASLLELKTVLGEGRATVGRRNARDGLDFARAANSLGVARGLTEFQRFGFLQRYGRTFLATPLNRVPVRRNVTAALIDQLERREWLPRFRRLSRRSEAPARLKGLGRRLDDALFELALRGDMSPRHAQEVLTVLGECMRYLAISPGARERCGPVPLLDEEWVRTADDGSAEFLLAVALAGLHARGSTGTPILPMVTQVAPVQENRRRWADGSDHQVVWGHGGLEQNLARVLTRRLLTARALELPDRPLGGWAAAPLWAVGSWLGGRIVPSRIAELMLGLTLARSPLRPGSHATGRADHPVPGAYRLLKPFFATHAQLERIGLIEPGEQLPLPDPLVRSLRTGDLEAAVRTATRRLRASGYAVPDHVVPGYPHGERLLAALMTPVSDRDLKQLFAGLLARPDDTITTHEHTEDHHAR